MKFEFATTGRVIFGRGTSDQIPALARGLGVSALLVVGSRGRGSEELNARLKEAGVASRPFHVAGEPTTDLVNEATALARAEGCDLVIAVGGGSVIDAGKAVAGMLTNPGDVLDYLEVVGGGQPLLHPAVPSIAVPTTAGTGAEATRNSVLDVPGKHVKVSLRSHYLLPRLAVIDPALTDSLPPDVTAYTGMDAVTQLIEALVGNAANPLTDGLCREGLMLASRSLPAVCRDGGNPAARDGMCVAALFSGMALANARLGAVHGLAGVLGGVTGHPHGALCARLLPYVMDANIRILRNADAGSPSLDRYTEIARIVTGNSSAHAEEGAEWAHLTIANLQIVPLRQAGLSANDFPTIISAAQRASSMQGNPVKLTAEQLVKILESAR